MTDNDLKDIIFEENDEYEDATEETILDTSRWSTFYEKVVLKLSDSTYWRLNWSRGSTELQDEGPEDMVIIQVFPFDMMKTFYLTEKEMP